jgi:hypothetical protein
MGKRWLMRGCPVTGSMMHRFDPVTHRCVCGRWQAGYKPKKEPVKPRAECQICECQQAVEANGCIGHHGYKRPGCGFIEGDCFGVDHKPYPETDALQRYQTALEAHLVGRRRRLIDLPTVTEFEWQYHDRKCQQQTVLIKRGEPTPRILNYCVPTFEDLLGRARSAVERDITMTESELARVKGRISRANGRDQQS